MSKMEKSFLLVLILSFISLLAFGQATEQVYLSSAKSAKPVTVQVTTNKDCKCSTTFKNTKTFARGARGGLFCRWTQKSGKIVKRYAKKSK